MHRWSARALALVGLGTAATLGSIAGLPTVAGAAPGDVTVQTAPPLVTASAQDVAVGDIKLVEHAAADVAANSDVCIDLLGGASWDTATDPVIAATAGATTSSPNTESATRVRFHVGTASSGSAATFTIGGLKIDPGATAGPVNAVAGTCSAPASTEYEASFRVAYVGSVDRVQGADRYATAREIAKGFACANSSHVVIARGDNYPDALAASYLAGKRNSPILLVQQGAVPQATLDALKDLGASAVTIVGGEAAISAAVATSLDNAAAYPTCGNGTASGTLAVTRVGGADRFDTAKLVAAAGNAVAVNATNPVVGPGTLGTVGNDAVDCGGTKKKTAIVASGDNYPDALAAGALAWAGAPAACGNESALPLLLTHKDSLPQVTADALTAGGIEQVILLGGTAAVSSAVETAIDDLTGVSVVRVSGADRQGTAVELTKRIEGKDAPAGLDWNGGANRRFFVARGNDFPDALVAGPLAGKETAPLLLSAGGGDLGTTAATGVTTYPNADFLHRGTLLGGESALTGTVVAQTGVAIANQVPPT